MRKTITETGSVMVTLWTVEDDDKNITKVIPSHDQNLYATFCQNSSKVYIGGLNTQDPPKKTLDLNCSITSI
jgi:hypothetical protein